MPAGLPPRRGGSPLAKRLKRRRNPNGKRCWFGRQKRRPTRQNESQLIMREPIMLISILTVIVSCFYSSSYPLVKILFSLTDASGTFSPHSSKCFQASQLKDVRPHHGAGSDRGSDRHLHRLHLRLYITRTNVPLQGLSEDHRHPAHPAPRPSFCACPSSFCSGGRS